jgi:hypothetical protein
MSLRHRHKPDPVIEEFVEKIGDFLEETFPNGVERDGQYYIGSDWTGSQPVLVYNQGTGISINMLTGDWYDRDAKKGGGAVALWRKVFNLPQGDILAGVGKWLTEGYLPDGRGVGIPPEPTVLMASDSSRSVKHDREELERWLRLVDDNQRVAFRENVELFAEWRGLSVDVFEWLVREGYLAIDIWNKTKDLKADEDPQVVEFCFPVYYNDSDNGIVFLGQHRRSLGLGKDWRYAPKGIPALPLIIGDLPGADLIVIGESTWDVIAYLDLYGLYEAPEGWCVIATRGALNTQHTPFAKIKDTAHITLLRQNDTGSDGDTKFGERIPKWIHGRARWIRPPDDESYAKDLNDWIKRDGADYVRKALANRF